VTDYGILDISSRLRRWKSCPPHHTKALNMDDNVTPIARRPDRGYKISMRSKHLSPVEWYNLIEIIRGVSTCSYEEAVECVEGIKGILGMTAPTARIPLEG